MVSKNLQNYTFLKTSTMLCIHYFMKLGIYDSGVGGLTTLAYLAKKFDFCDFVYFADNQNFPLGNKNETEILEAITPPINFLRKNCDIVVLGCNTASSVFPSNDVYKLIPPFLGLEKSKTLFLATKQTLDKYDKNKEFLQIETSFIAPLATMYAENKIDKQIVCETLKAKIKNKICEPENIILGCSHYLFLKNLLEELFPNSKFFDGNSNLYLELCKSKHIKNCNHKEYFFPTVEFVFSGQNETEKYQIIIENLLMFCQEKQD